MNIKAVITGITGALLATTVSASELIYEPVNPNFGGSPLNGSWLLNQANAQNSFEDPDLEDLLEENLAEDFRDSLERLILAQLAGLVVQEVFGDDGGALESGVNTFATDGFSITIDNSGGDSLDINITDGITGDSTDIAIPYFQ